MAVIETLYLLMKWDNSDFNKGAKEALKTTKDFQEKVEGSDRVVKKLGRSFEYLALNLARATLGFLSINSLVSASKNAAQYADALYMLGQETNNNVEDLDAWKGAVDRVSGAGKNFESSLKGMSEALGEISIGKGGDLAAKLGMLGIHVRDAHGRVKSALPIFFELSKVFARVGKTRAIGLGKELKLDPGLVLFLQKGPKAIEEAIEAQKKLGVTSIKNAEDAHTLLGNIADVGTAFRKVFENLNSVNAPLFNEVTEHLKDLAIYLQSHAEEVAIGIKAIAIGITALLIPALIGAVVASAPLLGLVTGAGLIYVALEKLWGLIEQFPPVFNFFVDGWHKLTKSVVDDIRWMVKELAHFTLPGLDSITKAFDYAKTLKDKISGHVTLVAQGQQAIAQSNNVPIALQSSTSLANNNNQSNRSTTVNVGPTTINTQATDAQGIANVFHGTLKDMLTNANNQTNTGRVA